MCASCGPNHEFSKSENESSQVWSPNRLVPVETDSADGRLTCRAGMRMRQQGSIIEKPLIERGKQVPGLIESLQAAVPLARLGQAEEVARLVLFLASSESSYMVGQGVLVDGGVTVV